MREIILQSYRTTNVPKVVSLSMATVRNWCRANGIEYRFVDNDLFKVVPENLRRKLYSGSNGFYPMTDIDRLLKMQQIALKDGCRVTWVDADVLIFRPELFYTHTEDACSFCLEEVDGNRGINNTLVSAEPEAPLFNEYLERSLELLEEIPPLKYWRTMIGPDLLTPWGSTRVLPAVTCSGLLYPAISTAIITGLPGAFEAHEAKHGYPMASANMCTNIVDGHDLTYQCGDLLLERFSRGVS